MRRRTTTKQLQQAITNNLLDVIRVECHYKSSNRIDQTTSQTFKENLYFLCESGVFSEFIDWHYERDLSEKDGYILDSGAMNPYSENVVTVYLRKNDSTTDEEIQNVLLFEENED